MPKIHTLLSFWIVSQLFFYYDWPVRPDRILFVLLLLKFLQLHGRGQLNTWSFGKTEVCMVIFTLVGGISLIVACTNVSSGFGKNTQVLQVANLSFYPFITYFLTKHIPYSKEGVQRIIKTLVIMGCYLG